MFPKIKVKTSSPTVFFTLATILFALWAGAVGTIIYVAWHFISKYW